MTRSINLMLETWVIECIKVNHKLEKRLGHEVEVVAHQKGPHETFQVVTSEEPGVQEGGETN